DPDFITDLQKFVSVCKVVRGLRNARIGAVGARPGAFNTVRYSEKILQHNGISVVTVDLSQILGNAEKLDIGNAVVRERIDKIKSYASIGKTPEDKLVQIAKLDVALTNFMEEH